MPITSIYWQTSIYRTQSHKQAYYLQCRDKHVTFLFIVRAIFLIQMASLIQRGGISVSLSITLAPSESITQLCLCAWSVIADLCSMFVDHFLFFIVKRLVAIVQLLSFILSRAKCGSDFTDVRRIAGLAFDLVYAVGLTSVSTLSFGWTSIFRGVCVV